MSIHDAQMIIAAHFDRAYLVETLSRLARVPTNVPLGYDILIEPDDPKLVHYVQEVVRPELVRIGCYDLIDAGRNNLVVRVGDGRIDRSLLILNYTVAQHNNLMTDPFSGKVANASEFGVDEPAVFGQEVSKTKAHQAVMLTVLKLLRDSGTPLRGRLYWAVVNEGRSSHECSNAVLDAIGGSPDFGILQFRTQHRISLGNRGRVDVIVHIQGEATHSSVPHEGLSAIDGAAEVIQRLKRLEWPDHHPLLGRRQAVVYKVRYEPVAPHTLPSDAWLTVDRRLLPGDDPEDATNEIRDAIGDMSPYRVAVERSVYMLPALVDSDAPGVQALQAAHAAVHGQEAVTTYSTGTFDAGGPYSRGVPTVMYGIGGGEALLGVDFVPIARAEEEARTLATLIINELG